MYLGGTRSAIVIVIITVIIIVTSIIVIAVIIISRNPVGVVCRGQDELMGQRRVYDFGR